MLNTTTAYRNITQDPYLLFLMGVSFFGLFLLGILPLNPPLMEEGFPWRKPIVVLIFGSICVLGILAAIFPEKTSYIFFVAKGDGSHTFSRSAAEHHRAKAQFDKVRREVSRQKRASNLKRDLE